jgi:hypothetical protein
MSSEILIDAFTNRKCDLMIDTGSSLGLLLKTTNISDFNDREVRSVIGLGFNGEISGYKLTALQLSLEGFEFKNLPAGIIESPWHNYASIGMEVLKNYVLILNYSKAYACFKKYES